MRLSNGTAPIGKRSTHLSNKQRKDAAAEARRLPRADSVVTFVVCGLICRHKCVLEFHPPQKGTSQKDTQYRAHFTSLKVIIKLHIFWPNADYFHR